MKSLPLGFWLLVGVAALLAWSLGHRHGAARGASDARELEGREAAAPLQPFTQPQPASSGYLGYGQVPFGNDAISQTQRFDFLYTTPQGAVA